MTTPIIDSEHRRVMRRDRVWRVALIVAVVVCLISIAWSWATRPFRMATKFVDLVNAQQYDEATKLVFHDDLRLIPTAFWKQFMDKEVVVLSSPGPWTLLGGGMGLTFAFQDPGNDSSYGSGIRFEVTGNSIRVAEVTFTEAK